MTLNLRGNSGKIYAFQGEYNLPLEDEIEDRSGLYAVTAFNEERNKYSILDIGESATLRTRVNGHDRADCWKREANGRSIRVFIKYTENLQSPGRVEIEQDIRSYYNPPCGVR